MDSQSRSPTPGFWPPPKAIHANGTESLLTRIDIAFECPIRAYRYLDESAGRFPCGEEFLKIARGTGRFSDCSAIPLTGGVAYLYRLRRAEAARP